MGHIHTCIQSYLCALSLFLISGSSRIRDVLNPLCGYLLTILISLLYLFAQFLLVLLFLLQLVSLLFVFLGFSASLELGIHHTTDERTTDTGCGIGEGTATCDSIGCCCTRLRSCIIVERIRIISVAMFPRMRSSTAL